MAKSCTVCEHAERVRIELFVLGGAGQRALSRKYGLSYFALGRHMKNHVTDERRANLILGPVQREALAAQVAEESSSVLSHHKVVRAGLLKTFSAVLDAGDANGVGLIAGRLTQVNSAIGHLTGELANSPLVQNNVVNNNFGATVNYDRLRDGLLQLSREHPEVRAALFAMLKRLDTEPAADTRAPLLIEQERQACG